MINWFKNLFTPVTADEITAPLTSIIGRLYISGEVRQKMASDKRDEADTLLLDAAADEKEAEKCLRRATKLEEFLS